MSPCNYEKKGPLLTINNVSVSYRGKPILKDVSQQICDIVRPGSGITQGQVVAILGPSGIGKTTLFRVLAGMEKPKTGSVLITKDQIPVGERMVGVVQQDYPLIEDRTVRQNLILAADLAEKYKKNLNQVVDEMLASFELQDQGDLFPVQLSGGQRQRAAIAQQLLGANQFLLMDEPFSGQDFTRLRKTCDIVRRVAQKDEEFTIVLVTHDIGAALAVADTVWMMGRVRDENGKSLGAKFVTEINTADRGIAWQEDPRGLSVYLETLREIEALFPSL